MIQWIQICGRTGDWQYVMHLCQHGAESQMNLVDSMPPRTETVLRAKGGPTCYKYGVPKTVLGKCIQ